MNPEYELARRRIKKRLAFRGHLAAYLICCAFLFAINIFTTAGPGYFWAIWPALGWGVGLAFHGFSAYGIIPDKEEENLIVERELNRMQLRDAEDAALEEERLELRELRKEKKYNEDDLV